MKRAKKAGAIIIFLISFNGLLRLFHWLYYAHPVVYWWLLLFLLALSPALWVTWHKLRRGGIVKRKIGDWLRRQVINLMDRFADTCWTELVIWYICWELHPFWEILELRHTAGQCEARGEPYYCGKCAIRGYHKKPKGGDREYQGD